MRLRYRMKRVCVCVCVCCSTVMSLALSARLQLGMLSFFWRNGVETPEPLKADVSGNVSEGDIYM